jgi:peroxiredoxin
MIELGQLEKAHAEFEKRKTRVIAISLDDQETSKQTQADFPHLVVVADADRKLADAVEVIHHEAAPGGKDSVAPTTILIDGSGTVRWLFRPDRFIRRLSPEEVLAAVDQHLK